MIMLILGTCGNLASDSIIVMTVCWYLRKSGYGLHHCFDSVLRSAGVVCAFNDVCVVFALPMFSYVHAYFHVVLQSLVRALCLSCLCPLMPTHVFNVASNVCT